MYLLYDSTFDGLLSAAAWCFRQGVRPDGILTEFDEPTLLETRLIPCERRIRQLFNRYLRDLLGSAAANAVMDAVYHAYLSEMDGIATQIWLYLERALQLRQDPAARLYERPVAAVTGAARRVGGQAHQFLGLLRFRLAGPSFYLADFTPDYHVLPLILPHFADRLSDQNFVIRDLRRHLAALHLADGQISLHILADDGVPLIDALPDTGCSAIGAFEQHSRPMLLAEPGKQAAIDAGETSIEILQAEPEADYSDMWRLYLQRLTIPERRNPALQQANMPKKYWKYLTENPMGNSGRNQDS